MGLVLIISLFKKKKSEQGSKKDAIVREKFKIFLLGKK